MVGISVWALLPLAATSAFAALKKGSITATDDGYFALDGPGVSYRFHIDSQSGDILSDHYGGPSEETVPHIMPRVRAWATEPGERLREFPDLGRGDFRLPAIQIEHADGNTITGFQYKSHDIVEGKPPLPDLPATFGESDEVSTLVIHMYDSYSKIAADLSYSIFPEYDAIVRSLAITNNGNTSATLRHAASWSMDVPNMEYEMMELWGDWSVERHRRFRKVDHGFQGFRSSQGYSGHLYNPFMMLAPPHTTEQTGEAYGFNLVYSGSFQAAMERHSTGSVRILMGVNPDQFSWPVQPGETFTTPEVVSVYSSNGHGDMSRKYHDLYRNNLIRSKYALETRETLFNTFPGFYWSVNATNVVETARTVAGWGIELFEIDGGWFGTDYPRDNNTLGNGDWYPKPSAFPNGLEPVAEKINNIQVANESRGMSFGLWVEPEMVSVRSNLYNEHPDWALHAGGRNRTLTKSQLPLNLALPEVQDFIIDTLTRILHSANITYIKWDLNRGIGETPVAWNNHAYMLGFYHVLEELTTRFPDVLWEGCASGGGRFDPGMLFYMPQSWASDDTDPIERLFIHFGTTMVYPSSTMGSHFAKTPSNAGRGSLPIDFRARVHMMGEFGVQLNPETDLTDEERDAIPELVEVAKRVNPYVVRGDMYRLAFPDESNWPAVQYMDKDGESGVVLAFQMVTKFMPYPPPLRFQGLDPTAMYKLTNEIANGTFSGNTLQNHGIYVPWLVDEMYQSQVIWIERQ